MATIKNTSSTLGNLINQLNQANQQTSNAGQFQSTFGGSYQTSSTVGIDDDSIPVNMLETEPVFEMNYKGTKKVCNKKARESIETIVKEIVPLELQSSKLILDKITQDAEQLGNLYYEYEKSDKVVQALMETIARGETQARNFEVYSKMSKAQQELSNLITETQNNLRKYYIDTYLDLQQTDTTEENNHRSAIDNSSKEEQKAISNNSNENVNIMLGTEQPIKNIANKKLEALKAKFQDAQEAETEDVD